MSRHLKLGLLLSIPLLGGSYWPMSNDSNVSDGLGAYSSGSFAAAVTAFRSALTGEGEPARLHYNLGTALYQVASRQEDPRKRKADLERAVAALGQASKSKSDSVREKGQYNLGNGCFLQGRFEQAIAAYRGVLVANPEHDDARHNLELALLAKRKEDADRLEARDAAKDKAGPGGTSDSENANSETAGKPSEGAEHSGSESKPQKSAHRQHQDSEAGEASNPVQARAEPGAPVGIFEKLDALERRSSLLRRQNMRRKTEAKVRPGARSGVDH